MPPARGTRTRPHLAEPEDNDQLVQLLVRIPARLRSKAHAAASACGMSTAAYVEQLLEQAPMPEPVQAQEPLPFAETA